MEITCGFLLLIRGHVCQRLEREVGSQEDVGVRGDYKGVLPPRDSLLLWFLAALTVGRGEVQKKYKLLQSVQISQKSLEPVCFLGGLPVFSPLDTELFSGCLIFFSIAGRWGP